MTNDELCDTIRIQDDQKLLYLLRWNQMKGINFPDGMGNTPLHVAVSVGNFNSVKTLLSFGADIN